MPALHKFMFFFFNDTATTEIYTLSLHDALPIYFYLQASDASVTLLAAGDNYDSHWTVLSPGLSPLDRKSTRLNSSHTVISYAVFCLQKKFLARRTLPLT